MNKLKLMTALVGLLLLGLSGQALAQLEVSPTSMDFGDVEVGTTSTSVVTVTNNGSSEIGLTAEISGSAFFVISSSVPALISEYETVYIQISFTPSAEGLSAADLLIKGVIATSLQGVGVEVQPPPSGSVQDILAFFDASVLDGSLVGSGPGNSADGRRDALRNMIKASGDLIEDGFTTEACQQLLNAYERCDGLPRPPEFVSGAAAQTLAGMILELVGGLGCE
ncbi:MAG: choice-of-anchor D domain-containing protein [Promethearchaeota archaeon]